MKGEIKMKETLERPMFKLQGSAIGKGMAAIELINGVWTFIFKSDDISNNLYLKEHMASKNDSIGIMMISNIIFFYLREYRWSMEAPYSVHLSLEALGEKTVMDYLQSQDDDGYINVIYLSENNIPIYEKTIATSKRFNMTLKNMMREQLEKPFDINGYDTFLENIYKRYTVPELEKMCIIRSNYK